ncbi:MAG: peptide deformylase [Desulfobacula sp.]|nr:peptide deformylase [Desulfobacula sp.]
MAVLKVLAYPEKSLLQPSVMVDHIDDGIRQLIDDMGETMFSAPGIGLAAPQIGVNKRVIVYDVNAGISDDDETREIKPEFRSLINPEIINASGSIVSKEEGCLSVLDYNADVKRYEKVSVRALNIEGRQLEFTVEGIPAIIMQHEIDHLDGILFIDRISALKRAMYKKKVTKKLNNQ